MERLEERARGLALPFIMGGRCLSKSLSALRLNVIYAN